MVHGDNNYRGFALTGMATAKIDRWGRVKIPSDLLKLFKEKFGSEVFVTSTDDRTIRVYPLAAWLELVGGLPNGKKVDPLLRQFLMKANYNGQMARVDKSGRVQIPGLLRKKIKLEGRIATEGKEGYLELRPESP